MKTEDTLIEDYSLDDNDFGSAGDIVSAYAPYGTARDELIPHYGMEIELNGQWVPAVNTLWNAWTGRRRLWSIEYHGPVYSIGGQPGVPYDGKRICSCSVCQQNVTSTQKYN